MVSDYRLALRRQRVRPVAANFFDDHPEHVDCENGHRLGTMAGSRLLMPDQDTATTDMDQVFAKEEQRYTGISKKTQEFLNQLFIFSGPTCYAHDGTAFNCGPPPGFSHRFRKTFGPVISVDADGTTINVSHHLQRYDIQASGSPQSAHEHGESAFYETESRNV